MPMCKGKLRYPTKVKAEKILNAMWKNAIRNGNNHKLPCRTYKCLTCKKWHLTSQGVKENGS